MCECYIEIVPDEVFEYENDVNFEPNLKGEIMKTYETYVVEINEAIASVKASSKKVFELLMDAQSTLSNKEYTKLKKNIDVDKSTFNKIEKIFANNVVMENISILPVSWGTLHAMTLVDEDALQSAIDDGKVSPITTRAEVNKLRSASETATSDDDFEGESFSPTAAPEWLSDEEVATPDADVEEEVATPSVILKLEVKNNLSIEKMEQEIDEIVELLSKNFSVEVQQEMGGVIETVRAA